VKKIPTVFRRDPQDMKWVLSEVHPDCQWVLDGEGTPTRKWDGTCVKLDDDGRWWARREVKPGKTAPPDFDAVSTDPNTGKTVGWEPVEQSSFAKAHAEVMSNVLIDKDDLDAGTYELVGPKINGNPEGLTQHELRKHGEHPVGDAPRDFEGLRAFLADFPHEGIVWHHPDGRMAKLKRRDFPEVDRG
jgi:hypothetical protein